MRAFLTLAAGALYIGFWAYAVVDCIVTDPKRVRGVSKPVWLIVVILFSAIGGILWFTIGKDRSPDPGVRLRISAPEDDPQFLRDLDKEADQDARIRELERQIAELDDDSKDS